MRTVRSIQCVPHSEQSDEWLGWLVGTDVLKLSPASSFSPASLFSPHPLMLLRTPVFSHVINPYYSS